MRGCEGVGLFTDSKSTAKRHKRHDWEGCRSHRRPSLVVNSLWTWTLLHTDPASYGLQRINLCCRIARPWGPGETACFIMHISIQCFAFHFASSPSIVTALSVLSFFAFLRNPFEYRLRGIRDSWTSFVRKAWAWRPKFKSQISICSSCYQLSCCTVTEWGTNTTLQHCFNRVSWISIVPMPFRHRKKINILRVSRLYLLSYPRPILGMFSLDYCVLCSQCKTRPQLQYIMEKLWGMKFCWKSKQNKYISLFIKLCKISSGDRKSPSYRTNCSCSNEGLQGKERRIQRNRDAEGKDGRDERTRNDVGDIYGRNRGRWLVAYARTQSDQKDIGISMFKLLDSGLDSTPFWYDLVVVIIYGKIAERDSKQQAAG